MGVRYRHADGAVHRRAHGNVYVLPPSRRDIIVLSGTGTAIWHAFAEPKSVDEVIAGLTNTFDAPVDVLNRDVQSAVDDFSGRGLLVVA